MTPAGEIEPALPDPQMEEVSWVHRVNFYTAACEKCGRGPAERKATPVCDGEPRKLNRMTAKRYRKEEALEDRADRVQEQEIEAIKAGVLPHPTLGMPPLRLTTDETLEGDLQASLEVTTPSAPTSFELPLELEALPQFAFVTGAAGTGKTTWAKTLAAHSDGGVVLCATTGIASVNLGEGTTINSFLRFFNTASLREAYTGGFLEGILKKHRGLGLRVILLDEVSMMCAEQLTIITRAIDNVNADKPEGVPELGLILAGDVCQLAPVPDSDPRDPTGRKKLPVEYPFESAEWERYATHTLKLTKIRRQSDVEFVNALQAVRRGAIGEALAYFGPRMVATTDMHFPGPTIVAKNDAVEKYNQLRLDAVKGSKVTFPSSRWGKLRPEWGAPPKPAYQWGVPEILLLKEGCRVMLLANKNVAAHDEFPVWAYTNGDLGTFKGKDPEGRAVVTLDRTGTDVAVGPLNRFNEVPLEPGRRKALKAEGHPERVSDDGKHEYVGGIVYYPIRLAYCSTVHRSQGLSLEQVQVNIRDAFFGQPSMVYVALSRARSVEGLRLVGTPEGLRARITVSPKVKEWL